MLDALKTRCKRKLNVFQLFKLNNQLSVSLGGFFRNYFFIFSCVLTVWPFHKDTGCLPGNNASALALGRGQYHNVPENISTSQLCITTL